LPFEVATAADVDKAMKILVEKKVDLVKIWVDDHLGKEPKISIDLCKLIIAGAKKHGLKVSAHIFYLDDAKKLVDADFTVWRIRSATSRWTMSSFNS
jgi:macrodomain Ter protein organizer (MatP/YcbG family)